MKLIEWYYYLFYTFYKATLKGDIKSLAEWYASIGLGAVEIFSLVSVYNYYQVFVDNSFKLRLGTILFPLIIIMIIHHLAFDGDKWSEYAKEFDEWPNEKKIRGSWIATIILLVLIINIIVSYYLLTTIK
jgi:purine-cytosine permease-like protein